MSTVGDLIPATEFDCGGAEAAVNGPGATTFYLVSSATVGASG
jgi:hypothetical protein